GRPDQHGIALCRHEVRGIADCPVAVGAGGPHWARAEGVREKGGGESCRARKVKGNDMRLRVGASTDTGRVRALNEDVYVLREDRGLFIGRAGRGGGAGEGGGG